MGLSGQFKKMDDHCVITGTQIILLKRGKYTMSCKGDPRESQGKNNQNRFTKDHLKVSS
jgi:hypothetical protein